MHAGYDDWMMLRCPRRTLGVGAVPAGGARPAVGGRRSDRRRGVAHDTKHNTVTHTGTHTQSHSHTIQHTHSQTIHDSHGTYPSHFSDSVLCLFYIFSLSICESLCPSLSVLLPLYIHVSLYVYISISLSVICRSLTHTNTPSIACVRDCVRAPTLLGALKIAVPITLFWVRSGTNCLSVSISVSIYMSVSVSVSSAPFSF